MLDAVGAVDVDVAVREEQRGVARRAPAARVAGLIPRRIGFRLDDATAQAAIVLVAHQDPADQKPGERDCRPRQLIARKRPQLRRRRLVDR